MGGRCCICCYSPLGLDATLVVLKRGDDKTAADEISQLTAEVNHHLCSEGNSKLFYPTPAFMQATVSVKKFKLSTSIFSIIQMSVNWLLSLVVTGQMEEHCDRQSVEPH